MLLTGSLSGCGDCGRCAANLFELDVQTPGGTSDVTVTGISPISCVRLASQRWRCQTSSAEYGDYTLTVAAPGFDDQTVAVTLADQGLSGCECPETVRQDVTLSGPGLGDAGASPDAG